MLKNIITPSPVTATKLRADARYGHGGQVSAGIELVLAANPKDYTGSGTNTYIAGNETVWIIDPGPDNAGHIASVLSAIGSRSVAGILVTHSHLDHSPAAKPIAAKTGAKIYGFGALAKDLLALTDEDVDEGFDPDVALADGHLIGDGDWQMMALHTPGHFPNHMAFYLPHKGILFSGDHVMGWSTTVVVPPLGNMGEYLSSLDKLEQVGAHQMLPSHGPVVDNPTARIREVRDHRKMRQQQVETCLKRGIVDPADIVAEIYEGLTDRLIEAAKGCVAAHIECVSEQVVSPEAVSTPRLSA